MQIKKPIEPTTLNIFDPKFLEFWGRGEGIYILSQLKAQGFVATSSLVSKSRGPASQYREASTTKAPKGQVALAEEYWTAVWCIEAGNQWRHKCTHMCTYINDMIWFMVDDIGYEIHDIWYDIWYDMKYDFIQYCGMKIYDLIGFMIWYDMTRYNIIQYNAK